MPSATRVLVNQVGYLPHGPKRATVVTDSALPVSWQLVDASGSPVTGGLASPPRHDAASGLTVQVVDLTDVTEPGSGYTIVVDGATSHPFAIDPGLYQRLRYDALDFFYLARSGTPIDAAVVGDLYARAAGHVGAHPNEGDTDVPCIGPRDYYDGWTGSYRLDVHGGWYDAGDHGKYVVNGGIAVAQLLGLYERALHAPTGDPDALDDGTLRIPEHGDGVPDVLSEARWELEWMLRMQVPEGEALAGMVHHKVHDEGWTGLPMLPADDPRPRSLHRPSTAATLNVAAVGAQGARLFRPFDAAFADRLLAAARRAWDAATEHPDLYAPAAAGRDGGGPYDDTDVTDERYWAAAELYLTTGEDTFRSAVLDSPGHTADVFGAAGPDWGSTGGLGRMDLATIPNDLPGLDDVRRSVVEAADRYLAVQAAEGFATTYAGVDGHYGWGSTSMVANTLVVVGTAFDLTGDPVYREAVLEGMDHLLGRNALGRSYITGYGSVSSTNQHSRWFARSLDPALPPPPRGSLAGGPNSLVETWDPVMLAALDPEAAPQTCYVDHVESWASNEITVNWNSALAWVASFVADQGSGAGAPAWPTS
ncbi:glycoside hydrolase family 9 protein [Sanguibacter suaedae]|uniref:Endoglucanase n=1 Tax=Sanguibacter suaedae TaxID=2795737 RepID=A0A934I9Y6_9MICO|nr:glycoside hydrolase family 9 protein [Sanguibacter suaedae]MBI9113925.1 glycoside hydrolase family 9 protein [Sanguibacter suaedae]